MSAQPLPLRRQHRVRFPQPLRATVNGQRAFIVDASVSGMLISHRDHIGDVGAACVVRAEWEGREIELHCKVVRTDSYDLAHLHTGLAIARSTGNSTLVLKQLLDSILGQTAAAQAEPPLSAFIRHELRMGSWREVRTLSAAQPDHGFTISAAHAEHEVVMLRRAYERASANGDHEIIRRLAAMSIGESPE